MWDAGFGRKIREEKENEKKRKGKRKERKKEGKERKKERKEEKGRGVVAGHGRWRPVAAGDGREWPEMASQKPQAQAKEGASVVHLENLEF